MSVCPNCGAHLTVGKFQSICEYCGFVAGNGGKSGNALLPSPSTSDIKSHYIYLQKNSETIATSPFVSFNKRYKTYTLESAPFYSNDGMLSKIEQPHWQFKYQNDGSTETLLIGITANRPAARMALKIDDDIHQLKLHSQDSKTAWFALPFYVLLKLCTAREVNISTDIKTDPKALYNELPIFASRFYNAAFDRMKFIYSVNVRMITDD